MKKLRIYIDTSVFGGCFDDEFAEDSKRTFKFIGKKNHRILISETVQAEILSAPLQVQGILKNIPLKNIEVIHYDEEVAYLQDCYLKAKILSESSMNDAAHVAAATVGDADIILSWNFKHIVNVIKIRQFNAINLREGYKMIEIRSPKELVYEEEI